MQALLNKLKIKPENILKLISAHTDFEAEIKAIHSKYCSDKNENISHIFYFVTSKLKLENEFENVLQFVDASTTLFICFPKGKSKISTDLSHDKGWEIVNNNNDLRWVNLISVNDDWSAILVRKKTAKELNEFDGLFNRKVRDTSHYNADKKEVYLPEIFESELTKHTEEQIYFNSLAFTHRKEYVGYIIEAKKEETKIKRIEKVMEMLANKKKNLL